MEDYKIERFWFKGTEKIKEGWMYRVILIKHI